MKSVRSKCNHIDISGQDLREITLFTKLSPKEFKKNYNRTKKDYLWLKFIISNKNNFPHKARVLWIN